jgi:hypothetical protein
MTPEIAVRRVAAAVKNGTARELAFVGSSAAALEIIDDLDARGIPFAACCASRAWGNEWYILTTHKLPRSWRYRGDITGLQEMLHGQEVMVTGSRTCAKPSRKRQRFCGVLYAGNAIRVPFLDEPVVMRLKGMKLPRKAALLYAHQVSGTWLIGQTTLTWLDQGRVLCKGWLDLTKPGGKLLKYTLERGDPIGMSGGWQGCKCEKVRSGYRRRINGSYLYGPSWVAWSAKLIEVSLCRNPCDPGTLGTVKLY